MTKYRRNGNTLTGQLHDEIVMMDIGQGKYFSLNPVATRVWHLLDEPRTLDYLCDSLIEEYDVDPVQCRTEVAELLAELEKLKLVIPEHTDT